MVFETGMSVKSPVDCDGTMTALQLAFLLQFHTSLTMDFQIDFQILPVHKKFGQVRFQPLFFHVCWVCPKIYAPPNPWISHKNGSFSQGVVVVYISAAWMSSLQKKTPNTSVEKRVVSCKGVRGRIRLEFLQGFNILFEQITLHAPNWTQILMRCAMSKPRSCRSRSSHHHHHHHHHEVTLTERKKTGIVCIYVSIFLGTSKSIHPHNSITEIHATGCWQKRLAISYSHLSSPSLPGNKQFSTFLGGARKLGNCQK